jgi:ferredoxin-thioredoxin reductase catalytic subunit
MASKKTPEQKPELSMETPDAEAAEAMAAAAEAKAAEQQAEIERLKKALAEAQKNGGYRKQSDREIVKEAIDQALAEGKDLWNETVSIRVRPRKDTNEKQYWCSVNGRTMAVPADDKYHEMRLPFAECLVNAMHAEQFVEEYADRKIQVYDPISNPHPDGN